MEDEKHIFQGDEFFNFYYKSIFYDDPSENRYTIGDVWYLDVRVLNGIYIALYRDNVTCLQYYM